MVIPRRWSDLESHVQTVLPALWPVSQDQHLGGVPTSYPELLTPKGIESEGRKWRRGEREGRREMRQKGKEGEGGGRKEGGRKEGGRKEGGRKEGGREEGKDEEEKKKGEESKGGIMGESVVWSVNPSFPSLWRHTFSERLLLDFPSVTMETPSGRRSSPSFRRSLYSERAEMEREERREESSVQEGRTDSGRCLGKKGRGEEPVLVV